MQPLKGARPDPGASEDPNARSVRMQQPGTAAQVGQQPVGVRLVRAKGAKATLVEFTATAAAAPCGGPGVATRPHTSRTNLRTRPIETARTPQVRHQSRSAVVSTSSTSS